MTLVIPEECEGCGIETCVCRECQGDQAEHCLDLNGNMCRFEGKKTCLWYQEYGERPCWCGKQMKYVGSRHNKMIYRCECGLEMFLSATNEKQTIH